MALAAKRSMGKWNVTVGYHHARDLLSDYLFL